MTRHEKFCIVCKKDLPISCFKLTNSLKPRKTGRCKDCANKYYNDWYHANKDKTLLTQKKSLAKRKAEGKDVLKCVREYRKKFPDRHCSKQNLRRADKISATPPWLTEEQKEAMSEFYWLARDLFCVTGQNYHVDHIVPLKGKTVCGLHVPWNLQVLPADVNIAKSNHLL